MPGFSPLPLLPGSEFSRRPIALVAASEAVSDFFRSSLSPPRSSTPFVEQNNNLLSRSRFPQARKNLCCAVQVSVRVHVGHGVGRQGDMVSVFVRLARGRLDPNAGIDARDHHLGDTQLL